MFKKCSVVIFIKKQLKNIFEEILAKKVLYEMKNQFFGLKKFILILIEE